MTHIPAISHCDVSNMSIKDAPGVAYLSSMIAWLPHFSTYSCYNTALSSAYSHYKPKKPNERGSTLIIKTLSDPHLGCVSQN